MVTSTQWAAFYGLALACLILSGNLTPKLILLFVRQEKYTLGEFGQVWANWHAVGCAFAGLMNLSAARDGASSWGPAACRAVRLNTAFIFGTWGVQNTYYVLWRTDLFTPLMWTNAVLCLATAVWSLMEKPTTSDDDKSKPLAV
eukprot:gnl/TRDRNA2_/TRDRNA2_202867_c0_seq1.p1 gnl/TRDRNA2_/TRDRNA2_202867_c0~~gnl/TRDRNA2_/TRDRNA2_202867_c0_seq1.p1  ORF type:complete len:144 (-),score=2.99 gnl/TRDRNA2_/TRDRNA2_202867_c0_seq1:339-770(-)